MMIVTKCCGNSLHGQKCVLYWHRRYRQEVRKRVAGERQFNKQLLSQESKLEDLRDKLESLRERGAEPIGS